MDGSGSNRIMKIVYVTHGNWWGAWCYAYRVGSMEHEPECEPEYAATLADIREMYPGYKIIEEAAT